MLQKNEFEHTVCFDGVQVSYRWDRQKKPRQGEVYLAAQDHPEAVALFLAATVHGLHGVDPIANQGKAFGMNYSATNLGHGDRRVI